MSDKYCSCRCSCNPLCGCVCHEQEADSLRAADALADGVDCCTLCAKQLRVAYLATRTAPAPPAPMHPENLLSRCECTHRRGRHYRYNDHDECLDCSCDNYQSAQPAPTGEALKACPFCGGTVSSFGHANGRHWCVGCDACGATIIRNVQDSAELAWNRRAAPAPEARDADTEGR